MPELIAPAPTSGMEEICACYFEAHVAPMLKIIQRTQELMNNKLEENYKELAAKVHQKADAGDVARLAVMVERKVQLSSSGWINGPKESLQVNSTSQTWRQDRVDAFEQSVLQERIVLAKKADSEHVATLVQLPEMRKELFAATGVIAEHKVETSTTWDNLQGNRVEAKEEQVDATKQSTPKESLSEILKSKLSNAEEDNERLQIKLDVAMKQLHKDLEEPPLEREISFLSDDSAEDSPCSSKSCTHKLHGDEEASLQQVEPPGETFSKHILSKMLKLKLTNAEEENERLQWECERLSKQLFAWKDMTDTTVSF